MFGPGRHEKASGGVPPRREERLITTQDSISAMLPPASAVSERELGVWLRELAARVPTLGELLAKEDGCQIELGYFHTLREIAQQPLVWLPTAAAMVSRQEQVQRWLTGSEPALRSITLTGSGSSYFVGQCLQMSLQTGLRLPVQAAPGGRLLTHGYRAVPPGRPLLIVSFARSGDSPESCGVVDWFLENEPDCRHLVITCNALGRLATEYRGDSRILPIVLDDRACDRSLVMTSSFTSMAVAGLFLGLLDGAGLYQTKVERLAAIARQILIRHTGPLATVAEQEYRSAVYLGSGSRLGAAREASLKMQEMSAGSVNSFAESFLGLRHGPMSAVHADTLLVCFLSSDPVVRAYEYDLLEELQRKQIGGWKVLVGEDIPQNLIGEEDVAVEYIGKPELDDNDVTVLDVLVGQLLAFFRCRSLGLRPDSPSVDGVIQRVVGNFRLHGSGTKR